MVSTRVADLEAQRSASSNRNTQSHSRSTSATSTGNQEECSSTPLLPTADPAPIMPQNTTAPFTSPPTAPIVRPRRAFTGAQLAARIVHALLMVLGLLECKIFNGTVPTAVGAVLIYQAVDTMMQRFRPHGMSEEDEETWSVITLWVNTGATLLLSIIFLTGDWWAPSTPSSDNVFRCTNTTMNATELLGNKGGRL